MRTLRNHALSATLLLALPLAQAQDVSAAKLGPAMGLSDVQVKAVPKRQPQQAHQDYEITNKAGDALFFVIQAPPAMFAEWKQVPGFEPVTGVGKEAFWRPGVDQLCAQGAQAAACVTLMPMAFPKDKKPSREQLKAALKTLI